MTEQRKTRGRPQGSEKDDSQILAKIADLLHASPDMKATTAMRQLHRDASEADIRRWQAKWKARKVAMLNEATARVEERHRQDQARHTAHRQGLGAVRSVISGMHPNPLTERLARAAELSPTLKALADYQNSPTMKAIHELVDSPVMKAIRAAENNPAMRLAREIENSPGLRFAREQQEMIDRLHKWLNL